MRVLGLQGSPRRTGNTSFLLASFMEEAERLGAQTRTIAVDKKHIVPCKEYTVCEKKGYCPIEDDMASEIYPALRWADVIVAASPVFFYNVTAQLKALIDRSQTLWARKYRLKLRDPGASMRRGCLLALGATKGKSLFDGVRLTAKYFFDAVDARFEDTLEYRGIEKLNDLAKRPDVLSEINACAARMLSPFQNRKKILFVDRENAGLSQMAAAFAMNLAGEKLEVYTGGTAPAETLNPLMVSVMAEVGLDLAFHAPVSVSSALLEGSPEQVIPLGGVDGFPDVPGARVTPWDIPDPAGESITDMRTARDRIEKRVAELIVAR
jgi:arsenate reductase (thioredoxin)